MVNAIETVLGAAALGIGLLVLLVMAALPFLTDGR